MKKWHNKGFTLVEIIVSITLLAMIALFMLPMSTYAFQFAKWNNIKLTAMNLAYSQVEWLKSLKYDDLGLDAIGYSPHGTVKEDLFMNEAGTNPKTIEGIDYSFLSTVYWEDAESTTGEFVTEATKKIDVVVKARDPISGVTKTFSVMGSLVAFEGERTPSVMAPLKVFAFTGENLNDPAKNVKLILNKGNSLVAWRRTDDEGKAYFSEPAKNIEYNLFPEEWDKSDLMMTRPIGSSGSYPNENWDYIKKIKITDPDDILEHTFYVDFPGYISLKEYDGIVDSTKLYINPNDVVQPEGETWDLDLNINLTNLKNRMIWRAWNYDCEITRQYKYNGKNYTDTYYFVEKDSRNLWNKSFPYIKDNITKAELDLAFGLKNGSFTKKDDGTIDTIIFEFTSQISVTEDFILSFQIYEGDNTISIGSYEVDTLMLSDDGIKCTVTFVSSSEITEDKLLLEINEPSLDELINIHGMRLPKDFNYCTLDLK